MIVFRYRAHPWKSKLRTITGLFYSFKQPQQPISFPGRNGNLTANYLYSHRINAALKSERGKINVHFFSIAPKRTWEARRNKSTAGERAQASHAIGYSHYQSACYYWSPSLSSTVLCTTKWGGSIAAWQAGRNYIIFMYFLMSLTVFLQGYCIRFTF